MISEKKPPVFLATFKGYYTLDQTAKMIEQLIEKVKPTEHEVHVAVPLSYHHDLCTHFAQHPLTVGTEMMLSADDGTFTQSIAGSLLKLLSCKFALIGSSQERIILAPKETSLTHKISAALEHGITPILAIGETLHDFEDGHSLEIMKKQLKEDLEGLSDEQLAKINILYDAPWISNSCWGDDSEYVPKAYASFIKAVSDVFGEKAAQIPLFFSIPCFAEHLPKIPKEILCGGYYFGVMSPSHTVEPIHLYSHTPEPSSTEQSPTMVEHALLNAEPTGQLSLDASSDHTNELPIQPKADPTVDVTGEDGVIDDEK